MRLVIANGAFVFVPHVAGFSTWPCVLDPSSHRCSRASPLVCQQHLIRKVRPQTTFLSALSEVWSCSRTRLPRGSKSRKRAYEMTSLSTTTTSTTSTTSSLTTPAETPRASLSVSIIGTNATETGLLIAERFKYPLKSMCELMKGRKGRKTDLVKVKAVLQWLEGEASGGVLTGFPETVAQAKLLEDQGVNVGSLVILHEAATRAIAEDSGGKSMQGHGAGSVLFEEGKRDGDYSELSRYIRSQGGNIVEVRHGGGPQNACDQAVRELGLVTWSPSRDSRAGDTLPTKTSPILGESDGVDDREGGSYERHSEAVEQATTASELLSEETLASRLATMSPSERRRAQELDPQAYEAAEEPSRAAAELKLVKKHTIREKKRAANEAQRMDTPFYLAVTGGNRKSRAPPPPPQTVPSRILERIPSKEGKQAGAGNNRRMDFGSIVLDSPASDCLFAAGISKPTGIQLAAMGPVLDGESVILHAMTGSGKTLAFLLPLMKRWAASFVGSKSPDGFRHVSEAGRDNLVFRVLIALPTRELAIQVAREAVLLSGGVTASVELLVDPDEACNLERITAPIVVGSAKVLERIIRQSSPGVRGETLSRIECIVIDEVDRLVAVLPKHAPPKEIEKRKKHARPIAAVLEMVLECKPDVQVVGCSATIGRPLRRHLTHLVNSAAARGATAPGRSAASRGSDFGEAEPREAEFRVIRDPFQTAPGSLLTERAVSIPETIQHSYVTLVEGEFFVRLEALAAVVRELRPRRPLIFVPPDERVTGVVAHLRRTGGAVGKRAVALHEAMGFGRADDGKGVRGKHSSEAIVQHDRLTGMFRGASAIGATETGQDGGNVMSAGSSATSGSGGDGDDCGEPGDPDCGAVLVTSEDTARGLHFDDVDYVFLMKRPKSPDEYVHLAGRTGRQGKPGNVVSLVTFDEKRKLGSWGAMLKIDFQELDLVNEDELD